MDKINYTKEDVKNHHGVSAIIKDDEGRILMQNHVKYGFWTIPVGKVKEDQTIQEALKQEVFEETNLKIEKCREIKTRVYSYVREGNNVEVIHHMFEVEKYSGKMQNKEPKKHKTQKFLTLKEIRELKYLSDVTLLYLETLGIERKNKIR